MTIESGAQVAKAGGGSGKTTIKPGVFVRLADQDKARAQYWADKRGFDSLGAYVSEAVLEKNKRQNHDYDLPTLEQARLAQLHDGMKANTESVANLERLIIQLIEMVMGMTRGSSDLLDAPEDGELDG
ncbi:hypothetical protein [Kocuria palustris]|uniref:hypothetical protein n=1 Tax=Kocuria palustris TaxID=71999 RepID=UPI0012E8FEF2|nr:hypothetical protein [Kocuria palustris]